MAAGGTSTRDASMRSEGRLRASASLAVGCALLMMALLLPASAAAGALISLPPTGGARPPRQAPTTAVLGVDCFYDVDADGVRDSDESRLAGYSFRLLDSAGTPVRGGMTGRRALFMTRIAPGNYTLIQLHPDESGTWFNTTGNPRTALDLRPRDRRGVIVGTAYSDNGYLLPRNAWVQYPSLIDTDVITQLNGLAPFSSRPFASAEQVAGFLGGEDGGVREELARELATFVLGFDRLAGGTRSAIVHEQRWKEAALLCDEAAAAWSSEDPDAIEAMRASLSGHNTGPVAYVPLQAPLPVY